MKCLVTGGAGFIGSNLAEGLLKEGHEVVIFDDFSMGRMENIAAVKKQLTVIKGDICNAAALKKAAKGCDIIFNEAAASSSQMFMKDLRKSVAINVDGFINVLHAAMASNAKVIYASTSSIYANNKPPLSEDMKVTPPNFYSITKQANEHLAYLFYREYGLRTAGFRYMSVYGKHEKGKGAYANMVTQFLWDMMKGKSPILYGNGKQTRDFVFVGDVVKANILAMNSDAGGEVINLGTGKDTSLNDLVKKLNSVLGTNIQPHYTENKAKMYIATQKADVRKARRLLGWQVSTRIDEGIKIIADHYQNRGV